MENTKKNVYEIRAFFKDGKTLMTHKELIEFDPEFNLQAVQRMTHKGLLKSLTKQGLKLVDFQVKLMNV